ncbi:MAG: hypothetical protein BECKG1743F_GA0114225_104671, partial [Candidatus Kentron sp. G]
MCRCPLGAPLGSRGSLFHAVKEPQLPSAFFAEYNSAIVRPRGRFISGVKV